MDLHAVVLALSSCNQLAILLGKRRGVKMNDHRVRELTERLQIRFVPWRKLEFNKRHLCLSQNLYISRFLIITRAELSLKTRASIQYCCV